jgi:hypothetical protein
LVRQLAISGALGAHGVLRPDALTAEVVAVRGTLASAVLSGRPIEGVAATQAVALLFTEYMRRGDTAALGIGRRALDAMLDSGAVAAATVDELSLAYMAVAEPRYRDAGRDQLAALLRSLTFGDGRQLFADLDGYAISAAIIASDAFKDSVAERHALAALDSLLRRVYATGRGVRHVTSGSLTGLLQDQVQVADACVAGYRATGRRHYLDVARDLAAILNQDFADFDGGYFDVAVRDAPAAPLDDRMKPVLDEMLPGANAWAAHMLLGLGAVTGDVTYRRRAEATLEAFAGAVQGEGLRGSSFLLVAREALASREGP